MYLRVLAAAAFVLFAFVGYAPKAEAACHIVVFSNAGVWKAYGGPCDSGPKMCGVSTSGEGKFFGLKYFQHDNTFTIQLGSNQWSIKNGAKQSVTMKIDQNTEWTAVGTGFHFDDGDPGLQFEIKSNQLDTFMKEFSTGNQLVVRFPGAREVTDWVASLDGSDKISESFVNCIKAM